MNGPIGEQSKIRAAHRERSAFVYVRQSSLRQVRNHLESQRRQYAFADQAVEFGWCRDRVVVVDEDQGKSGAIPQARAGFARLVGAVARGEVGLVMSLELSRLSRNDADWNHLVYLCRWTGALIADEHGVYDPSSGADRMVLGIRGQVSEMERDSLVHRMVEARWNKARRGEAFTIPPAGYDLDEIGQWGLTSDEAVQTALRRVFSKFDELGAARQVYLWWRDEGLPFPVRRIQPRAHPIVWVPVSYRLVYQALRHPIYAGAFVFGRSHTTRALDPETQRIVVRRGARRGMKDWPVLIQDHHPAYICFEQYLRNQERLRKNSVMTGSSTDESHAGAAREGRALLQGLARCGHCGRRMYVNYGGQRSARTLQYRCSRIRALPAAGAECQLVGGKRIETTVVEAFLAVTVAAGAEAAALAAEQTRQESDAVEQAWRLQIEKAAYEAQRAERQYMTVEPENRTIARELERRWNERLEELEAVRAKASAARVQRRPLTEEELRHAQELGGNLGAVWNAATTNGSGSQAVATRADRRGAGADRRQAPSRAHCLEGRRSDRSRGRALAPQWPAAHYSGGGRRAGAHARARLRRRADRAGPPSPENAQRSRPGLHQVERVLSSPQAPDPRLRDEEAARQARRPLHRRRGRARVGRHGEHRAPLAAARRAGGAAGDYRRAMANRADRRGPQQAGWRRRPRRLGRPRRGRAAPGRQQVAGCVLGQTGQAPRGTHYGWEASVLENRSVFRHLRASARAL